MVEMCSRWIAVVFCRLAKSIPDGWLQVACCASRVLKILTWSEQNTNPVLEIAIFSCWIAIPAFTFQLPGCSIPANSEATAESPLVKVPERSITVPATSGEALLISIKEAPFSIERPSTTVKVEPFKVVIPPHKIELRYGLLPKSLGLIKQPAITFKYHQCKLLRHRLRLQHRHHY